MVRSCTCEHVHSLHSQLSVTVLFGFLSLFLQSVPSGSAEHSLQRFGETSSDISGKLDFGSVTPSCVTSQSVLHSVYKNNIT